MALPDSWAVASQPPGSYGYAYDLKTIFTHITITTNIDDDVDADVDKRWWKAASEITVWDMDDNKKKKTKLYLASGDHKETL